MVKALFITLNLAGLVILPFLYVGLVNVEHQAPSEVNAGSSIEVEITLDKSGVTGPARLKLDFSDAQGLMPESIQNSGSSFSFNDESALFIWYSIQPDEKLVLKYRIKADANASGTKTISGTFSYLDEEERKTMDIPSIIVTVKGSESNTASNDNSNTNSVATNTTSTENIDNNTSDNSVLNDVTCNREISKSGDDFIIKIDINKGSNGGFARVKETVPNGFDAVEMEKSGAVFKFVDNNVKFLWTNLPQNKSTITLKYKLKRTTASPGTYNVDGEFSGEFLIVNDVPKSVKIPTGKLTVEGDAALVVDNKNNNVDNTNNNSNKNKNNQNNNQVANNKTTIVETGNTAITYKVQVLAAHKTVSNNYIKRHYGYSGGVALENHEGWVKYTTGSFGVYKEARDKRNSLNSIDFPGPFVTAYNKGERITVQEALMVSKQDWVK